MPRGVKKDPYAKLADAAVAYADAHTQFQTDPTKRKENVFRNRLGKLLETVEAVLKEIEEAEDEGTYAEDEQQAG